VSNRFLLAASSKARDFLGPSEAITARLPTELAEKLREYAKQIGASESSVVRCALSQFMAGDPMWELAAQRADLLKAKKRRSTRLKGI
jgi:predicted transcriptional regulator